MMDEFLKELASNAILAPVLIWFMYQFQQITHILIDLTKSNSQAMQKMVDTQEHVLRSLKENDDTLHSNRRALEAAIDTIRNKRQGEFNNG